VIYTISDSQGKQIYADDVNLLGYIGKIKKNTQTAIDARKEVGLEVNTEKTK
jgi:hypothetical protein